MLTNIQQRCFDFAKNLKFDEEGFRNIDNDFPEILDSNMDTSELLKLIMKDFEVKIAGNKMSQYDKKLLNITYPKIKEILMN